MYVMGDVVGVCGSVCSFVCIVLIWNQGMQCECIDWVSWYCYVVSYLLLCSINNVEMCVLLGGNSV